MEKFEKLKAVAAPMGIPNVDTDAIIPKQFLKSIRRTGYGPYLFDAWRYDDDGVEPGHDCSDRPLRPDFVLNQPRYQGAGILLARENFGCGSSREHAVWALLESGFRCVIAPSFADIFYSNCGKNGLLAISLPALTVERMFEIVNATPGCRFAVDLEKRTVTLPGDEVLTFPIDDVLRRLLLEGLDDIGVTLKNAEAIRAYENARAQEAPWLFPDRS